MKLHVTVGPIHYMVYLGNGLLGTEDEIDCCFSKKGGQNDWENLYGFRGSLQKAWEIWDDLSLSFLGKEKATQMDHSLLVVTFCSYCPDINRSQQQGAVGEKGTDCLFRHHVLLKQLRCTFFARGKMGRKPPLAALATAHVHNWSCLGETVGKLGMSSKRFWEFKIKFQVE